MSNEAALKSPVSSEARDGVLSAVLAHWPLFLGGLVMGIPTMLRLAEQVWPLEIGAHGPIVLATGIWLLFHIRSDLAAHASTPNRAVSWAGFLLSVGIYCFGRAYDLIFLEASGLYGFFLTTTYTFVGARSILKNLFPFFYLLFLIPIPGWILDQFTMPLREFVSWVATGLLSAFGYPIAREGIVILIGSYRLLVEDACSGMNSLIGLIAVIMFYIYIIHRASWRYSLALLATVVPIAIFVNILRVMALILLTYHAGDAVAQGFLHVTTGIVLFAAALFFVIIIDRIAQRIFARRALAGPGGRSAVSA